MFPARKMHTFAVDLALQIMRNTNLINQLPPDAGNLDIVESKLHQHWLADNKVNYIKELRSMCSTPGKTLNLPDRIYPSVEQALIQIRGFVEKRTEIHLSLVEAKHIADIVWDNAESE